MKNNNKNRLIKALEAKGTVISTHTDRWSNGDVDIEVYKSTVYFYKDSFYNLVREAAGFGLLNGYIVAANWDITVTITDN